MIRKINSVIFVIACFMLFQYGSFLKLKTLVKTKQNIASITLSVDNDLQKITVNGVPIPLSGTNLNDWPQTKTFPLPSLQPGDVIAIQGENQGTVTNIAGGNPAAVIAHIKYYDEHGSLKEIITGDGWTCDGVPAKLFNVNSDTSSIWQRVKGGALVNIPGNAYWIWNPSNPQKSICQIEIPCCTRHN
jgi:hypothetical protein